MRNCLVFVTLAVLSGCGTESPDPAGSAAGSGGGGGQISGGSAGQLSGGGGASSAGAGSSAGGAQTQAGQAGSGGSSAGTAGAGGSSGAAGTAGAAGAGGGPVSFQCSQLTGPNVAGEWFDAGFETAVGTAKWQVKAPHHSFVEDWANPNHDVWLENCQGTYTNCETKSKCESGTPDRVLFVTQTGDYLGTSQATWEASIKSAITTLKGKYPELKRVELLTFVRAPSGQDCGGETTVSPMLDAAQQAVAAASAGFVTVGPHLNASACALFSGPPHMNTQGNMEVADQLAEHYKP